MLRAEVSTVLYQLSLHNLPKVPMSWKSHRNFMLLILLLTGEMLSILV